MMKMKRLLCMLLVLMLFVPAAQAGIPIKGFEEKVRKALATATPKPVVLHADVVDYYTGSGYGQWKKANNDRLQFRCKIYNHDDDKTIKAVELYLYAKDVWGDDVYEENTVYYHTTTKKIAPDKWGWSDYFTVPDRSKIDKVYVGVKRVVFTDGTVQEAKTVDYKNWTIEW